MKNIFLLAGLFLLTALSACRKLGREYTISGRVLQDCGGQPYANKTLSFWQQVGTNLFSTSGGELGTTTTDANGNFTFNYNAKNSGDIRIQTPAGFGYSTLMSAVPSKKNLNDISIVQDATYNLQLSLNVLNPRSASDTLLINSSNFRQPIKVPCPLKSGVISNAPYPVMEFGYGKSSQTIIWNFKTNSYTTPRSTVLAIDKYCSDTVRLVLDID